MTSEPLASIEHTRAAIGWTGYPAWYWPVMAGVLALPPVSTMLPAWWDASASSVLTMTGVVLAVATTKVRGVRENRRGSLPVRDGLLVVAPALAAVLAGAFTIQAWWWSRSWSAHSSSPGSRRPRSSCGTAGHRPMTEPTGFDSVIHAPVRSRLCAALEPVREIEFGTLLGPTG